MESYAAINLIYGSIIFLLTLVFKYTIDKYKKVISISNDKYCTLLSQKKSSEVRLGQISENLTPFLKELKYDPKKCHFLGNPIDYIIFEEDKIVFLEIKSGQSKLSKTQLNIKKLIADGKVYFDQMQIN